MASFNEWVKPGTRRYERIEGGYQNVNWDPGNYTGGKVGVGIQAGTNMSISAPVLSRIRNHPVTAAEMQALPRQEALDIYYRDYWMKILGDEINSQLIANFLGDMKSSGGGVWNIQKALNDLGENLSIDGSVGQKTLEAINRQTGISVADVNNAFRNRQIEYYKKVGGQGLSYWVSSLNRDYPEMSKQAEKLGVPEDYNNELLLHIGIAVAILALLLFLWIFFR